MNENRRSSKSGGAPKKRGALWPLLALLLVVLVVVFLIRERGSEPGGIGGEAVREEEATYSRSALLYYAAGDGESLAPERRELLLRGHGREEFAIRLVSELARDPLTEGSYATLPPGTLIRGVFFDDMGELYVDFDGESLRDWSWGTSSEILAIRSIVRTLSDSFPEVARVGFLVDGNGVETLGGHVDATHPFEAADWR
ncbi:MAG: GerMN domain-containing protein [Candidatus Eisenbacteria bacterium]